MCNFFWVFPRRLIIECRRFGNTLSVPFSKAGCEVWSVVDWKRTRYLYRGRGLFEVVGQMGNTQRLHTILKTRRKFGIKNLNPLNAELSPICYLLALLAHHFLHVSRIRVKSLTLRLLMPYIYIYIYIYIYGAPILDVSRSHTTTQHIR